MSAAIVIRPAAPADFATATRWLRSAGLPTDDLTVDHMTAFLLAASGDKPIGMIGLEGFGTIGLLRSLVVDRDNRSGGIGRRLVAALEAKAVGEGIRELWLLTIDADNYFRTLSYEVRDRDDAPTAIRETPEFSSLCPGDAVLMSKVL